MSDVKYSAENLSEFLNKKVKLVQNLPEPNENGEGAVEIEGTIQAVNQNVGLLIKPRGSVQLKLLALEDIEEVTLAPEKAQAVKRTTLKPIELGKARRHLLDRHAFKLAQVTAMTEEEAFTIHEAIDHLAEDLGHKHSAEGDSSESSDE